MDWKTHPLSAPLASVYGLKDTSTQLISRYGLNDVFFDMVVDWGFLTHVFIIIIFFLCMQTAASWWSRELQYFCWHRCRTCVTSSRLWREMIVNRHWLVLIILNLFLCVTAFSLFPPHLHYLTFHLLIFVLSSISVWTHVFVWVL